MAAGANGQITDNARSTLKAKIKSFHYSCSFGRLVTVSNSKKKCTDTARIKKHASAAQMRILKGKKGHQM